MKRDYRMPSNFEDFVYVSQLLQAEGMRTGIEAHRRNKPYCMGTLYWQLNDVWPVASWSSTDYYGRWKAMQYYVREAYAPVAALPFVEDGILHLYGVSEIQEPTQVDIRVRALSFNGKVLSDATTQDLTISPDSSRIVWRGYLKSILDRHKSDDAVIEVTVLDPNGLELYQRLVYLVPPKKLSLPRTEVDIKVEAVNDGYLLTVQSDKLAKNVCLQTDADGFFENNYFDLLAGERRQVLFKTKSILDSPETAFRAKHLAQTN
jgi:beta-mannosidase